MNVGDISGWSSSGSGDFVFDTHLNGILWADQDSDPKGQTRSNMDPDPKQGPWEEGGTMGQNGCKLLIILFHLKNLNKTLKSSSAL